MELAGYKACICEGSAENAIIDILLDYDLLIFSREEMLEEEVIRCRDGKVGSGQNTVLDGYVVLGGGQARSFINYIIVGL